MAKCNQLTSLPFKGLTKTLVVRGPSVGTAIRVTSVQIGDLVEANCRKNSLRSGSAHPTNPATRPPGFANLLKGA